MGFHAPQEAARILGEAVDYARQGEVAALKFTSAPLSRVDPAAPGFDGAGEDATSDNAGTDNTLTDVAKTTTDSENQDSTIEQSRD